MRGNRGREKKDVVFSGFQIGYVFGNFIHKVAKNKFPYKKERKRLGKKWGKEKRKSTTNWKNFQIFKKYNFNLLLLLLRLEIFSFTFHKMKNSIPLLCHFHSLPMIIIDFNDIPIQKCMVLKQHSVNYIKKMDTLSTITVYQFNFMILLAQI